ncbi:hypothetical protein [Lactobacillus sp. HT06-2]|nr:hypothetical protein [Lactobacillus sp. HT06-2]
MTLGPIVKRDFQRAGNQDLWTYGTAFKSLNQLKKQSSGSLKLSVPIAGIKKQTFKVWFAFGVKNVAKSNVVQDALNAKENENSTANEAAVSSVSQPATTKTAPVTPKKKDVKAAKLQQQKQNAQALKQLKKYRVKPQKQVFAEIALAEYPILQTVLIFLGIDLVIIAGVGLYWWHSTKQRSMS